MDYYAAVAGQPAALERSAVAVRACLAELDLDPWRRGLFATVSMGASTHAGHALAHRLGRRGRRAVNLSASGVIALGGGGLADSYVFVSEGGRSRETIEAATLVSAAARLGITNVPDAPLSTVVDAIIPLDAGEDSKVYTAGYTTTLQAFGLLASALDGDNDGDDWKRLPELVSATLDGLAPLASEASTVLARATVIDVVAGAGSYASAAEAALLLRESTRISTATYETYQYLHGPMEPLTPAHACLIFGDGREVPLARYLAGAGIPVVLVTSAPVGPEADLWVLGVAEAPTMSRAVLDILPAQLLAGEMARGRGLGIDGFLYHQDDTKVPEDSHGTRPSA
jgi:fructoselysine-6-P-deglycase FrlB-like protein